MNHAKREHDRWSGLRAERRSGLRARKQHPHLRADQVERLLDRQLPPGVPCIFERARSEQRVEVGEDLVVDPRDPGLEMSRALARSL
jgi:hypothetical protein